MVDQAHIYLFAYQDTHLIYINCDVIGDLMLTIVQEALETWNTTPPANQTPQYLSHLIFQGMDLNEIGGAFNYETNIDCLVNHPTMVINCSNGVISFMEKDGILTSDYDITIKDYLKLKTPTYPIIDTG